MSKDIIVNGIEICIKDGNKYNEFCDVIKGGKEIIQVDNLEGWQTTVRFLIIVYSSNVKLIGLCTFIILVNN